MKRWLSALFVALFAGSSCNGDNGNGPDPPTAAVVTSIAPTSGTAAGGTPVTITGSNFVSGATAAIGGVALTGVNVASSTSITGTTGASTTAGAVAVTVTNPGASAGTLPNGFTYISAPVARISGVPATIQHDALITFSGTTSTTTAPATITTYAWDCGQDPSIHPGCIVANNPTPQFRYKKCGVSGRPACTIGNNQRTYTVTLTITDSQGRTATTTFQVTVTNSY